MITDIRLRNFKCFSDTKNLSLNKINIFTGYNGAGKSSIFQSFLLIAQSIDNNELLGIRANGKYVGLGHVDDLIKYGSKDRQFSVSFKTDNDAYKSLYFQFKPDAKNGRIGKLIGLTVNGINQFATSESLGGAIGEKAPLADKEKAPEKSLQCADWSFLNLFRNIHYLSANRYGPTLYEVRNEVDHENPLGERGEHCLEVLKSHPEISDFINEAINYIMNVPAPVILGDKDESGSVLSLSFGSNECSRVKSVNTGFGFSYILPLLLAAELGRNGKIFIENPEAHLHPQAQSRLIQVLADKTKDKNNQLFIETHSEHVINGLRLACLLPEEANKARVDDICIYFFEQEGKITKLEMDEDAQLYPWPDGFFDQQQKDSSEILKRGLLR